MSGERPTVAVNLTSDEVLALINTHRETVRNLTQEHYNVEVVGPRLVGLIKRIEALCNLHDSLSLRDLVCQQPVKTEKAA